MAELTISPDEIRGAIEQNVAAFSPGNAREEVGRVIEVGDGIARVEGLHSAMTNELLEFEGGLLGLALNLDVREIGCVLLGDPAHIEEGQQVKRGAAQQTGGHAQACDLLAAARKAQPPPVLDDIRAPAGEGFRQVQAGGGVGIGFGLFGDVAVDLLCAGGRYIVTT